MSRVYAVLATVALLGGLYGLGRWQGYSAGTAAAEARQEAARVDLQRRLAAAGNEIARLATEAEAADTAQRTLAMEIENEARQDPDAARPGIGADGVLRLKRRWGAP